jgi:hypothetical protein
MNLEAIAPIIEKIVKDTLRERRYPFGHQGRSGLSNKVASGTLVNSVKVNLIQTNNVQTLELDIAGYGQFVNDGRVPGKKGIPLSAIMQWLNEKGIGVRDERGRFVKGHKEMAKSLKSNDIHPIAYAIQKSIERFGIRSSGWIPIAMGKIQESQKIMGLLEGQAMADLIKIIEQE